MKHQERILVVPGAELDRLGRFQGVSDDADRYLSALLATGVASFRVRAEAEENPAFKQIIPYVIFVAGESVFCYTRGTSQGEARLHCKRSLGVGGHVDEADFDGDANLDAYERALRRELDEEVRVASPGRMRRVGLINDDENSVGAVHLGVVHLFELDEPAVTPLEEGLADARFVPIADLPGLGDRFETWSQFCIDALQRWRRGA